MSVEIEIKWRKRKKKYEKEGLGEFFIMNSSKSEGKLPIVSNFSELI